MTCSNPDCQQMNPQHADEFLPLRENGRPRRRCRSCRRAQNKARYQRQREEKLEWQAGYYVDHREERTQYSRDYYASTRDDRLEYRRQYNAEHPEVLVEWRQANPDKVAEHRRRYREKFNADPDRRLAARLKRYGLTLEQYLDLYEAQDGACAICKEPETRTRNGVGVALCIDHDHQTNEVRGLLCSDCNVSIGKMRDDPARLIAAAEYLLRDRRGELSAA